MSIVFFVGTGTWLEDGAGLGLVGQKQGCLFFFGYCRVLFWKWGHVFDGQGG